MRRRAVAILGAAFAALFMLAVVGAAADTFEVRVVSQTNSTITLGWNPQPGYGYLFSADGALVSRTNDASRSTVRFAKGSSSYEVAVIVKGATGKYPPPAPPPPPGDAQAPSAPPNLRVHSATQTQIVLRWDPSSDNVGVTNYRIYRDGSLIGQSARPVDGQQPGVRHLVPVRSRGGGRCGQPQLSVAADRVDALVRPASAPRRVRGRPGQRR
jgi:hypothetical protein